MSCKDDRLQKIGIAIAGERERQHISQSELSHMLGYTNHAHLSRVEGGKKAPSLDMLFRAADALGVQVSNFIADV